MSKHGKATAEIGRNLKIEGCDVFYDHDEPSSFVGKIASSIDKTPAMGEELSQLDIAIIEKITNKVVALIEVEETTDTPKTFLGDIFGILMGKSVSFKGNSSEDNSSGWKIGNWTTLIIIGKGKNHEMRNDYLSEMAIKAKSALETENSKIGDIVVKTFSEEKPLKDVLMKQIEVAKRRNT